MASKPPDVHLPECRWAWDGSPCLCPKDEAQPDWALMLRAAKSINRRLWAMNDEEANRIAARGIRSLRALAESCGVDLDALEEETDDTDYEALGYPETACGNARLDEIAWLIGFIQRATAAISEKDIPAATDIVDSAAKDSYNKDIDGAGKQDF